MQGLLYLTPEDWGVLVQEFSNSSPNQTKTQVIWKQERSARNNHLMVHTKRGSNIIPERQRHCTTIICNKYTETTPLL